MTKKTALLIAFNVMMDMLDHIRETEGQEEVDESRYCWEIKEAQKLIQNMYAELA